jgi:hypothetical protein
MQCACNFILTYKCENELFICDTYKTLQNHIYIYEIIP